MHTSVNFSVYSLVTKNNSDKILFYEICFCVYLVSLSPVLQSYDVASDIKVAAVGLVVKTLLSWFPVFPPINRN
jgi:hypothetical protein